MKNIPGKSLILLLGEELSSQTNSHMRKIMRNALIVLSLLFFPTLALAQDSTPVAESEQVNELTITQDISLLNLPEEPSLQEELILAEEPNLPEKILGTIEGNGTTFEVTDSEYLNITLVSTVPIQLTLESIPEMITMHIEAAEGAASTMITLSGLEPTTVYYKYTDDYHNLEELITDDSGTCTYTQDLSEPHFVFIQPTASTIFLSDTGWSQAGIGTWDATTLTATLTTDVSEAIQIDSDNITLDGAGHTVTGSGTGTGIYLSSRTGVTIKNVKVQSFHYGIMLAYSTNNTLISNVSYYNSNHGFVVYRSSYNNLSGNGAFTNDYSGISINLSSNNTVTDNRVLYNTNRGINTYRSRYNSLTYNTISNNGTGIYAHEYSDNNILSGNTISYNNGTGIVVVRSSSLTMDSNTISNNLGSGLLFTGNTNNNTLSNNTVLDNNAEGIIIYIGSNNTLIENTVSFNGKTGIIIYSKDSLSVSFDNTLTNNIASNNGDHGILIGSFSYNNILSNNETMQNGLSGILASYYSKNNTLNGNLASNNVEAGIHCYPQNIVTGNTASYNKYGILLSGNENIVSGNIVLDNEYGIAFWGSKHNTASNNTALGNDYGIYFNQYSYDNTIFSNRVETNYYGMGIFLSNNNVIYNNDFIDNTTQVRAGFFGTNTLNKEAPIGGNYWSNHTGPDENGDGFIDYSYRAYYNWPYGYAIDYLPLVSPYGGGADNEAPGLNNVVVDPSVVEIDSEVTFSATVDDTGTGNSDISSAEYSLDGGEWTEMYAEDGSFDSPTENVYYDLFAPSSAGVYDLCVRGTDIFNNVSEPVCTMLVAYDPDAGFVIGGGWIYSIPGAYVPDPTLEGKANFGFVSRYKKGANAPTGNTEFQFQTAGLNFHSQSYDWMVVTGSNYAKFKGIGTINGEGNYKFMLWAGDGTGTDGKDTFRIKIWTEDEETADESVIYDNGFDQEIGGGSIVVHTRK